MENQTSDVENTKKLDRLIKDIKVAMLTTIDEDATLRSRPMGTQQAKFDGDLWFFTALSAPKVFEMQQDHRVNLSYVQAEEQRYVSVSGTARLVVDPGKAKELWDPAFREWFPDGPDDPDLALIKVEVERAEYWDVLSGKMEQMIGFTSTVSAGGENRL